MITNIPSIQEYDGRQILLASDRLAFVSKGGEHILFNSSGLVHTTSKNGIYFDIGNTDDTDTEKKFLINAPRIQFGLERFGKAEPVVKADELKTLMIELIDKINGFNDLMSAAASTSPTPVFSSLYKINSEKLKGELTAIKLKLDNFKSKITYTV